MPAPGSRGHTDAAISGRSSPAAAPRGHEQDPGCVPRPVRSLLFSSGWLWLLRCLGRRRITSGHGTYFGVVLWSEVQLSASVPGTTRTPGTARYRPDLDQLRPPPPQRLRPPPWGGVAGPGNAAVALPT